ncbi:MAG: HesA/MoeB/ThiF family protein, partial [Muribaculaceae bacterium]|nr:HesA/MoeB/ThiF family protein [Muribaculaceae bacterium]
ALIVGLGGLGCPVGLYLAGAGVGRIGLCDSDTVSASNLQRQTLYGEAQVGEPKVEAARRRLAGLNSGVRFEPHPAGLTPERAADIIAAYDVVVDCCDNFATRYLISDTCRALGRPWVHGTIGEFRGQVATFMPGRGAAYDDLYPDREALSARPAASGGVLGAVPGVVGAIQAAEALKVLLGMEGTLAGRLLSVDLSTMTFNTFTL